MGVPFDVETEDLDENGTVELLLYGKQPSWPDEDSIPFRDETRICMWNGQSFSFFESQFSPPQYRFQAVQDGDQAAMEGNYDIALDLYQQTIFSDQLDWWSLERWRNEVGNYTAEMYGYPTPTPEPSLAPDPDEYASLAAYARYRIMLLHVLRGWNNEAQIVYETLLEKYPEGETGCKYAELAKAFWAAYQSNQDMALACDKAISYATEHQEEILTYLGRNSYSGMYSKYYHPEDICPFK